MKRVLPATACFEHYHPIDGDGDRHENAICAACDFTEALQDMIDGHAMERLGEYDEPPCDDVAFLLAAWSKAEAELRDAFVNAADAMSTHQGNRKVGDGRAIARHLVDIYILLDGLRVALEVEHPAECVE